MQPWRRPGSSMGQGGFARRCLVASAFVASVGLCGFSYQPLERSGATPGHEAAWKALDEAARISNAAGAAKARITPGLRAMAGHAVSLDGYLEPLGSGVLFRRFLLRRAAPCAGCAPRPTSQAVEVFLDSPTPYAPGLVLVRGRFAVAPDDPGTGVFRLYRAHVVSPQPNATSAKTCGACAVAAATLPPRAMRVSG